MAGMTFGSHPARLGATTRVASTRRRAPTPKAQAGLIEAAMGKRFEKR